MKIHLEFLPTPKGMSAEIKTIEGDDGKNVTTETISMEMPEPIEDAEANRQARLSTVREFFQKIGDQIWSDMSPDDFKEPEQPNP